MFRELSNQSNPVGLASLAADLGRYVAAIVEIE